MLAKYAQKYGQAVSDYVLAPNATRGIFIVAEHDEDQREFLRYIKLGEGPHYVLVQNYHLVHLEIIKTIRRIIDGKGILLNNSEKPAISVAAIAKKDLKKGDKIENAIGSFKLRGEAILIKQYPEHVPIGLLSNVILKENVSKGQMISFGDVELEDNLAFKAWESIRRKTLLQA